MCFQLASFTLDNRLHAHRFASWEELPPHSPIAKTHFPVWERPANLVDGFVCLFFFFVSQCLCFLDGPVCSWSCTPPTPLLRRAASARTTEKLTLTQVTARNWRRLLSQSLFQPRRRSTCAFRPTKQFNRCDRLWRLSSASLLFNPVRSATKTAPHHTT